MELNKDKLFTLADIEKAFDSGYEMLDSPKKYNDVLVRGGRARDLPGIRYTIIRGKLDLLGLLDRRHARSKYGTLHPSK
jgi:ribosomal protein S12